MPERPARRQRVEEDPLYVPPRRTEEEVAWQKVLVGIFVTSNATGNGASYAEMQQHAPEAFAIVNNNRRNIVNEVLIKKGYVTKTGNAASAKFFVTSTGKDVATRLLARG